ncbi:flagellar protein FliO/FliZ [Herbaspirillum sp. Sphag1AN]|uniref:flagellar biosynthetic protein FliO n=1 Tax=unclassified Herbaspirillum TaxID=2624150 RepID=UPI0016097D7F|nr:MULTISPECIES: flagellar biosynthetic protein FliO [unclassified Herbaspirillum]MBB3211022.1 flagellar protein FliO/FliZ [Herbaspirillum sp. Sphag1AN]MBB3244651.1 flagellar protein FliO/FliZ [Herbaspirillum sp. Sphag64]
MKRFQYIGCVHCSYSLSGAAIALLSLFVNTANAADIANSTTAAGSATGSVFTMLLGLGTVLALLVGLAWLFKRTGLVKGAGSNAVAKIIGGVSVGTRERVMVIEVAEQWIVVGVAPGRVNTLATMPRQEHLSAPSTPSVPAANFSAWLKQTIDKRNGSSE